MPTLFKYFSFSDKDTFWDKVLKIRKFCEQEKLTQYWQKLNEIAQKKYYFAADTGRKILKIIIFFNRVQGWYVTYSLLIQYYNHVFQESLSPETIARNVRHLVKYQVVHKRNTMPAKFFVEVSSGTPSGT